MASLQSIADWIHDMVNDAEFASLKGGRCTAIGCVHVTDGGVEQDVYSKQLPDKFTAESVDDWADLFDKKMRSYAEGIPGAQTFCLLAFHNGASRPTAKKPFVVKGYTELDGLMTEGPTGKGHLTQMMRHVEGILSRSIQKDQILFDALTRTIEAKTREAETYRQENVQSFGLVKELILAMAGKQHEQRLAEIAAQSDANLKTEISKWVPRLLNAATGKEVIPQPMLDSQMVEDFIDALASQGEAALPALAQLKLPGPLLAQLAHRFQQGMVARQKEETTRKTIDDHANGRDIDGLQ